MTQGLALVSLATGAIALTPQVSQAALFSADLDQAGDGLITRDTRTGLEWLDLTPTINRSYAEVAGGLGGYTTDKGFRFATAAEVRGLFDSALTGKTGVFNNTPTNNTRLTPGYFAAQEIHNLLGATLRFNFTIPRGRATAEGSIGLVGSPDTEGKVAFTQIFSNSTFTSTFGPFGSISIAEGDGNFMGNLGRQDTTFRTPNVASFLVRSTVAQSTPEPSMVLGGLAIVLAGTLTARGDRRV